MRDLVQALVYIALAASFLFLGSLVHLDVRASDLLAFVGTLLGASLTVAGAIFLSTSERDRQHRENRELLLALLGDLDRDLKRVEFVLPHGGKAALELRNALEGLARRIRALQDARRWLIPDSAGMIRAYGYIGEMRLSESNIEPSALFLNARSDAQRIRRLAKASERNLSGAPAKQRNALFGFLGAKRTKQDPG